MKSGIAMYPETKGERVRRIFLDTWDEHCDFSLYILK